MLEERLKLRAVLDAPRAIVRWSSRFWNMLKWRQPGAANSSEQPCAAFGDVYLATVQRRPFPSSPGGSPRIGLVPTTSIPSSMENARV